MYFYRFFDIGKKVNYFEQKYNQIFKLNKIFCVKTVNFKYLNLYNYVLSKSGCHVLVFFQNIGNVLLGQFIGNAINVSPFEKPNGFL